MANNKHNVLWLEEATYAENFFPHFFPNAEVMGVYHHCWCVWGCRKNIFEILRHPPGQTICSYMIDSELFHFLSP